MFNYEKERVDYLNHCRLNNYPINLNYMKYLKTKRDTEARKYEEWLDKMVSTYLQY